MGDEQVIENAVFGEVWRVKEFAGVPQLALVNWNGTFTVSSGRKIAPELVETAELVFADVLDMEL